MSFQSDWFAHPRFLDAQAGRRTIKRGERGDAVKVLQSALIELGEAMPISTAKSGGPDGIFGSESDQCVRNFQRKALPGEVPDGKVGPKTLAKLDSKLVGRLPPKSDTLIWGDAPAGVPGSPTEVDLGTIMGWHSAVKQHYDMACWAACLSFWAKYCGGGRPIRSQARLIPMYSHLTSSDGALTGGMPTGGLRSILTDHATPGNVLDPSDLELKWKALFIHPFDINRLTYDWLKANAGSPNKAIFLGYSINGAAHINVIGHYDFEGSSYVWAMEPWDGRFKLREIDYYRSADRSFFAVPMG